MERPYDIFISYRRKGAGETAYIIYQQLEKAGYRVFFDVEQMKGGSQFNVQLLDRIAECRDFILVLPPGGLDRCDNEDDWVRQEIEQALRCQKPIIPIMLRDFTWPEAADLPPSIRNVRNWQAITAGSFETFPDIMSRLGSYLKSTPKPPSPFRRMLPGMLATAVLLLGGIGGMVWWFDDREQKTVATEFAGACSREADAIAHCMTVLHQTLALSDSTLGYWKQFYENYAAAGPDSKKEKVIQAKQFLGHQKQQLETAASSVPAWKQTETERKILSSGNVSLADLDAFHGSVYPAMIKDFQSTFSTLENYLGMESVPRSSVRHLEFVHDIYLHQVKSLYYQFLSLLAAMPESARKDYRKISAEWSLFPNDLPSANPADLEANADREMKRAETVATQFSNYVAARDGGAALNAPEQAAAYRKFIDARTDESLKRAKAHEVQLDEMRVRFLETDKKLTESYARAIQKFAIHTGDNPDLMWGKVLRMATLANNTRLQRTAAAQRNKELARTAREQGTDTSFLTDMPYTVTVNDMFAHVDTWLTDCERNMPSTPASKVRFSAARAFYQDVAKGELPCQGIQVVGTKDDRLHPVYRIGDIVTRRSRQPVNSVEEYQTLKPDDGPDTVTILRYTPDGRKETLHTPLPETSVPTAFLPMLENEL